MNIYIVDIKTTDLIGGPFDLVIEIDIVEVDLTKGTSPVYILPLLDTTRRNGRSP